MSMEHGNISSGGRLFSLDLLRGLDMMLLVVVYPLVMAAAKVWNVPPWILRQLEHPRWVGFTVLDMVMPLFIFMCGASIPFSLERRLEKNGGRPDAAYWKHVVMRFLMLWGLGLLVQGYVTTLDPAEILPYSNTLQTIACGYLVAACLVLSGNMRFKVGVTVALAVLYGVLQSFGDYTRVAAGAPGGDFAVLCESKIVRFLYPERWAAVRIVHCDYYTWYVTSPMFVVMTMCGYFATRILKADRTARRKLAFLGLYAGVLVACGAVLSVWVPVIKHTFSVSFTALAMGISVALLAVLYWLTDVLGFRRGLGVCILFGQFALTAYLCEEYFKPVFVSFTDMILRPGVARITGRYLPVVAAVAGIVEVILVLMIRRGLKRR